VGATQVPPLVTTGGLAGAGLPVTTNVPAGVGVLSYTLSQPTTAASIARVGGKRILKTYGFPKKPGLFKKTLKARALRGLKPGSYVLTVRMGSSRAHLGRTKTIRFRVTR
jgi:hypothetical protein